MHATGDLESTYANRGTSTYELAVGLCDVTFYLRFQAALGGK